MNNLNIITSKGVIYGATSTNSNSMDSNMIERMVKVIERELKLIKKEMKENGWVLEN